MDFTHHRPEANRARRDRLAAALHGSPALIAAGGPVSRNYPDQTYPYRASSHFLYFVGLPLVNGVLLIEDDAHTLFVPPPGPQDALWIGEAPGLAEIAERTGCAVRPLSLLADAIGGRDAATLPGPDPATRAFQTALLGREVQPTALEGADAALADAVIALRLVHDEAGIDSVRRACAVTVAAHRAGMAATRPSVREWTVRAAMEAAIVGAGMTTAYGPIVTVRGEVLHNEEHHGTLGPNDLLLADVGAESPDGWASDVTRTWPTSGKMSTTQREMYDVVLAAQRAAIDAVTPGVRYRDVHLVACTMLTRGLIDLGVLRGDPSELVADGVHALLFPHGVGHLLGLDVHDMEDLGDRAGYAPGRSRSEQFGLGYLRLDRDLAPGMAVTIEPGLYNVPAILKEPRLVRLAGDRLDRDALSRFSDVRGIRIEDDVLVTHDGAEVLTAALPTSAPEIEAMVGAE